MDEEQPYYLINDERGYLIWGFIEWCHERGVWLTAKSLSSDSEALTPGEVQDFIHIYLEFHG